jgi:hypothetical protein
LANSVAAWLVAAGVLGGALGAAAGMPGTDSTSTGAERAEIFTMILAIVGLLPGLVARSMIRGDIKHFRPLLRDGAAYTARVVTHTRLAYGGLHKIVLRWKEHDREATADFDVPSLQAEVSEGAEVTVLATPDDYMVGASFEGETLTLGRRA